MNALRSAVGVGVLVMSVVLAPEAAALVTLPPGSIAVPESGMFLYVSSEPGDWVGGGVEQLFTSADSSFAARLPVGGDFFSSSVVQTPHSWAVALAAPIGQALAVGSYTGALGTSFRTSTAPGMAISGDGHGCNIASGQFDVSEMSFAPTGELMVFDATFEQRCEGATARLFGRIRIDLPAPTPGVTLPPGALTIPTSGTFLYLNSQPGDYIGQGTEQLYTSADSEIAGSLPQGTGYFYGYAIQGNYTHFWRVEVAAPPGDALTVGSYISADPVLSQRPGHPGLHVHGDGSACNTLTGKFDVDELSFWPTGRVKIFQATFEQHCSGANPALYGRIRLETPEPLLPLQMSVTINEEGTVDMRTGAATISGTVLCSRAAAVDLNGWISQVFANKYGVADMYRTHIDCAAPSTTWSATLKPWGQEFIAGHAQATVEAKSCDLYCIYGSHYAAGASEVKLNAGN